MKRIFFATLLVFMLSAATALAATWDQIYIDGDDNTIYIDQSTVKVITRNGDDATFSSSFKQVYSERGRNNMIDWYRNNTNVPPGIEDLSYDISVIQFKKEGDKRYFCITDRNSFNSSDQPIEYMHYTADKVTWQEITIGSLIEVEYNEAKLIVDGKRYKRIDAENL